MRPITELARWRQTHKKPVTRLLQKIEAHTGHVMASPYPPPNTIVTGLAPGKGYK